MLLEKSIVKTNYSSLFKKFAVVLVGYFILELAAKAAIPPNVIPLDSFGWWLSKAIVAVGIFTFLTIQAKRERLTISETVDNNQPEDFVSDYLVRNGQQISSTTNGTIILESNNSFNRLFNNWFGSELVFIQKKDDTITVEGPHRQIDLIDYKLRFGKDLQLVKTA